MIQNLTKSNELGEETSRHNQWTIVDLPRSFRRFNYNWVVQNEISNVYIPMSMSVAASDAIK